MKLFSTHGCMAAASLIAFTHDTLASASRPHAQRLQPREDKLPRIFDKCIKPMDFMITFDDGPSQITDKLLDTLEEKKVKAAFFVNGQNGNRCIYDNANALRRAFKAGHAIGSHTWSHKLVSDLSEKKFKKELDRVETAMQNILGVAPRLYMPPYGEVDTSVAKTQKAFEILKKRGYNIVYWNLAANSGDDEGAEYALNKVKKFIQDEIESGISVSLDPNEEVLTDVVPAMIDLLKDGGYNLVDADTCLGVPVYDPQDPDLDADLPKKDDDKWKCPKDDGN